MSWEVAASIGAGLMNSIIGTSANQNLNWENRRWQEKMSNLNYERQKELLQLTPQLQKSGIVQAGMSPAALGNYSGPSATVQTSSAPTGSTNPPYVGLDVGSILNAYLAGSQVDKNKADTDYTKEETREKRLNNDILEDKINAYKNASSSNDYFVGVDGVKHFVNDSDFDDAWNAYYKAKGVSPEVVVAPQHLSDDAYKARTVLSDIATELSSNERSQKLYALESRLYDLKLADPNVMYALSHMDSKQFDLLGKQIEEIGSRIDLNKVNKELTKAKTASERQQVLESFARIALMDKQGKQIENNNMAQLIDQLFHAKSAKEGAVSFLKILITAFAGANGGQLKL